MRDGTQLWLARHGETYWNRTGRLQGHSDVALSPEGERQARLLAERLAGREFAALYTSDLKRASSTARIVGDRLGLEAIALPALREVHVGEMAGLTAEEVHRRFTEQADSGTGDEGRWPGGESDAEHETRVWDALQAIASEHPGQRVLVVTHGGSIRAALKRVLGLPTASHLHVVIENTALTVFVRRRGQWYLGCLNEVRHLGELSFN